jgi:hypothetical protein
MDSLLEWSVPGVCGFLLLCPIVVNTTQDPRRATLIRIGVPPGVQRPEFPSRVTG